MAAIKNQFNGFNPDIYKFFRNLERNNSKEFFDKNRSFYENEIREPLKLFAVEMTNYFYSKGLQFGADPNKSVFRINRDIRFSKNKDPYKTNLGVIFPFTSTQKAVKKDQAVGIYLHYERDKSFIACGLHSPLPDVLKAIREKLLDDWKEFEKIIKNKSLLKEFNQILTGESLSNPPRGFPKDHPAEKYLKLKDFTVWSDVDHKAFYSKEIMDILIVKAKAVESFTRFLLDAVN